MATSNPYLQSQQDAISGQVTNTLNRQIMPGINRGAIAAGGYGGSRQGIAQGMAINGATDSIANATANMQGQAYEMDANRSNQASMHAASLASQGQIASMQDATNRYGMGNQYSLGQQQNANQRYGMDQNYALGQGQLGLGYQNSNNQYSLGREQNANTATANQNQYNLGLQQNTNSANANNQNFYTAQRGQDLQSQGQGFNQYLESLRTQMGMGAATTAIGREQFNAPGNVIRDYGAMIMPASGINGSTNSTTPQTGGGLAGALGGGLTAAQLWSLISGGGAAATTTTGRP